MTTLHKTTTVGQHRGGRQAQEDLGLILTQVLMTATTTRPTIVAAAARAAALMTRALDLDLGLGLDRALGALEEDQVAAAVLGAEGAGVTRILLPLTDHSSRSTDGGM